MGFLVARIAIAARASIILLLFRWGTRVATFRSNSNDGGIGVLRGVIERASDHSW